MFADILKARGWAEATAGEFVKGDWRILFDTSSWIIVSTTTNPLVFDVHVPGEYEATWTANLIEHLCRMEDERRRLRETLARIRDGTGQEARPMAREALESCYHAWLLNPKVPEGQQGRFSCPICRKTVASVAVVRETGRYV